MKNLIDFVLLVAITAGLILGLAALLGAGIVLGGLSAAAVVSLF